MELSAITSDGDPQSGWTIGQRCALCRRDFGVALTVSMLTFLVFSRSVTFDFVNFDDNIYVTQNTVVQEGLSLRTVGWAWTAVVGVQWYPLTLLSHLLDVSLFGLNPAGHHATSVLIHSANAGLLCLALVGLAGWRGAALAVSCLFALHPLRVESVAWIAERKDVLSGLFWMLTLLAYGRYAQRPGLGRYTAVFLATASGLMCKPMAVTIPCVLLLLDAWPLGRFKGPNPRRRAAILIAEKVPLFGLSFAAACATWLTQSGGGAVASLEATPPMVRGLNAIGTYWVYFVQTLLPIRLAVFYPMPEPLVLYLRAAAGCALFAGMSWAAYRLRARVPALGIGWLWFVGTLVPVIGVIQVGAQSHADRYTYIPQIGLFIAGVWTAGELWPARRPLRVVTGGAIVAGLAVLTWIQLGHWRSSETLFEHALRVTARNARAHDYYGQALAERGEWVAALGHYETSIRLEPGNPQPRHNLAVALAEAGNVRGAAAVATQTLALFPEHVGSLFLLGSQALVEERSEEAAALLERAVALAPERADARVNLGICYGKLGREGEASAEFLAALKVNPQYAPAYFNLGILAIETGDRASAGAYFERALAAQPDYTAAREALRQLRDNN